MSRIGKMPIPVPDKVNVTISENAVSVKGPKGELNAAIPAGVTVALDGGTVAVTRNDDSREARGAHGLARTVVANMVEGVSQGYSRTLLINGVGYKAELRGNRWILFSLGFSHPILYELPEGVSAEIDAKAKEPKVTLSSAHKQTLGAVAADIRRLRPPEPYKGKGIRYADETIRRKEGKAAGK